MKQIIAFLALITLSFGATAQNTGRGVYGTYTPTKVQSGTVYKSLLGVPTAVNADTLVNVDTGYVYFPFSSNYNTLYSLNIVALTGTVAGTSILQGTPDGGLHWETITGVVTVCSTCKGASATIGATSAQYNWEVPASSATFPLMRFMTITSGTCTATYTGSAQYNY